MRLRSMLAVLAVLWLIGAQGAQAAQPSSGTVSAKPGGGSSTLSYSGQVPPGGGSVGDCSTSTAKDVFTLTVKGADASFYRSNDALLTVRIE